MNFDQSPGTEGVWLTPALLKLLFLVGKVIEVPVATFCALKLLLDLISAFGEWLPLLWGFSSPFLSASCSHQPCPLFVCVWGHDRKAMFQAAGLISFILMVGVIL